MFDEKHPFYGSYKIAKRIAIGIIGGTILLLGAVMIVTPGPGIPAILVGLGILGVEFAWARRWLKKVKAKASDVGRAIRGKNGRNDDSSSGPQPPPSA